MRQHAAHQNADGLYLLQGDPVPHKATNKDECDKLNAFFLKRGMTTGYGPKRSQPKKRRK